MRRALRAEWRKARTVRAVGLLLGGAILVEITFKGLFAALQPVGQLDRAGQYRLLGPTLFLALAAAILGVVIAGQEWRYRLAVPTYLAIPSRMRVLAAKTVVAGALAAVTGLAAAATANGVCDVVLNARATTFVPFGDDLVMIAGTGFASGLLAVGGVALGTLVRSQVAALGVATAVLFVVAPLTQVLVPEIAAALPNGAALALALQDHYDKAYLGPAAGGLLLVAEMGAVTALAARRLQRADVA
jgi:ABC-2 type transport system permease protein